MRRMTCQPQFFAPLLLAKMLQNTLSIKLLARRLQTRTVFSRDSWLSIVSHQSGLTDSENLPLLPFTAALMASIRPEGLNGFSIRDATERNRSTSFMPVVE